MLESNDFYSVVSSCFEFDFSGGGSKCGLFLWRPKEGLLMSLVKLIIRRCPLLREACQREKNRRLAKIAHISCIVIEDDSKSWAIFITVFGLTQDPTFPNLIGWLAFDSSLRFDFAIEVFFWITNGNLQVFVVLGSRSLTGSWLCELRRIFSPKE